MSAERPHHQATDLAPLSNPEQRVRHAKQQLVQHATELEYRTRLLARKTAWIAGAVLLGVATAVATATLLRAATRARRDRGDLTTPAMSGLGSALLLAAAGALNRRLQHWHAAPITPRYAHSLQQHNERGTPP